MRTLLAIALLLLLPASARAASFSGQRPVTPNAVIERAIDASESFWRARYGQEMCQPTYYVAPALGEAVGGRADATGACEIWIRTDLLNRIWKARWAEDRAWDARDLCTLLTHERGHTLGLGHTAHGLMAPTPDYDHPPYECARAFPLP